MRAFLLTSALGAMLIPAAFAIAQAMAIDIPALISPGIVNTLIGLAAVAPLAAMLCWFMTTTWRPIADFRASQIEFFSGIGFKFTRMRILILATIAGVSEELMFRGVLQTIIDRQLPTAAAIVIVGLLFGLLHARTALYAIIAALVGMYLGLLFFATGSLLAPIITHAVYDLIAFEWTRIAIEARRTEKD